LNFIHGCSRLKALGDATAIDAAQPVIRVSRVSLPVIAGDALALG
jgi:hypothetical protein